MNIPDTTIGLGEGFFETLLWKDNQLVDLELHTQRLQASLIHFYGKRLEPSPTQHSVHKLLQQKSIHSEARVRFTTFLREGDIKLNIEVSPYTSQKKSATLLSSSFRPSPDRPTAGHKSTSYADYLFAAKEAKEKGADDALLINSKGYLCECSTANLFFYKEGKLHTPELSSGCLPGIMRQLVIKRATSSSLEVIEGQFKFNDLIQAESIFITNSLRRIQQVTKVDNYSFLKLPVALFKAISD